MHVYEGLQNKVRREAKKDLVGLLEVVKNDTKGMGLEALDQWFPNFFDGGPNLIFKVSWRATEI